MAKAAKQKAPLSEPKNGAAAAVPEAIENFMSSDGEEFSGFASTDDEAEAAPRAGVSDAESAREREKIGALAAKSSAAAKDAPGGDEKKRGVVYVGRIPHGLYEEQLRAYLAQFGTITRLRISRNKKTGASKHYGFVEFASLDVAQIVCETMDNYLLFGHLLQAKLMDAKQVHPDLWAGANKKYHAIPWGQVKKRQAERKHSREWWEARQEEFDAARAAKARHLAELGIKY